MKIRTLGRVWYYWGIFIAILMDASIRHHKYFFISIPVSIIGLLIIRWQEGKTIKRYLS